MWKCRQYKIFETKHIFSLIRTGSQDMLKAYAYNLKKVKRAASIIFQKHE